MTKKPVLIAATATAKEEIKLRKQIDKIRKRIDKKKYKEEEYEEDIKERDTL